MFTLKLYYGGQWWTERGYRHYKGEKWRYVDYCDKDRFSLLDIIEMLEKLNLSDHLPMLYCYLDPIGDFKTGLRLVCTDNDILTMCSWIPRFKVIKFYAERRKEKEIINIIKSQPEFKKPEPKKSYVVIEEIKEENVESIKKNIVKKRKEKKLPLLVWYDNIDLQQLGGETRDSHEVTIEAITTEAVTEKAGIENITANIDEPRIQIGTTEFQIETEVEEEEELGVVAQSEAETIRVEAESLRAEAVTLLAKHDSLRAVEQQRVEEDIVQDRTMEDEAEHDMEVEGGGAETVDDSADEGDDSSDQDYHVSE